MEWPFKFWDDEEHNQMKVKFEKFNPIGGSVSIILQILGVENNNKRQRVDSVDTDAVLEDHDLLHAVERGSDDGNDCQIQTPPFDSLRISAGDVQPDFTTAFLSRDVLEKYTAAVEKL